MSTVKCTNCNNTTFVISPIYDDNTIYVCEICQCAYTEDIINKLVERKRIEHMIKTDELFLYQNNDDE